MKEWRGIRREDVPWFPTIDAELCTGCKTCVEFCKNDVLAFDGETEKVLVANPFHCVVECRTCSRLCPSGAISFPAEKDFAAWLQEYRGKS